MFIIFGWRQLKKLFGPVFKQTCSHCHNEDFWVLKRISTWFKLFFIPVFPVNFKYFFMSPVCEYEVYLSSAQVRELRPIAELNSKLINGHVSKQQYDYQIGLFNQNKKSDDKKLIASADTDTTQRNVNLFCSDCGLNLTEGSNFCVNCGSKIQNH